MAKRPVFCPRGDIPFVTEISVEFKWFPGMATSQAQKSIQSLHEASALLGYAPLLEISSKSPSPLGIALSAFNLKIDLKENWATSVECAYQGSKVFESGGPFHDLYRATSLDAKKDDRLRTAGRIIGFNFLGMEIPATHPTAFYDWLYIRAILQNVQFGDKLLGYCGFTDIAFNPEKSWNCQARSAAIYLSLVQLNRLVEVGDDPRRFQEMMQDHGVRQALDRHGQVVMQF